MYRYRCLRLAACGWLDILVGALVLLQSTDIGLVKLDYAGQRAARVVAVWAINVVRPA